MGSFHFSVYQAGLDVANAFEQAREDALYEHGHGGYTGTIAEKNHFVLIDTEPMLIEEAEKLAAHLSLDHLQIKDSDGAAGAIAVKGTRRVIPTVTAREIPGGHTDKKAAVLDAVADRLKPGEHVVFDHHGSSGAYKIATGNRVMSGTFTNVEIDGGAMTHTGFLFFGCSPC